MGPRHLPAHYGVFATRILHVVVYLNDILITGQTQEDHLSNLREVLKQLQTAGLRKSKCIFMAKSVQYLGHIIDEEGLRPMSDKI